MTQLSGYSRYLDNVKSRQLESLSGPGSTLENTRAIVAWLPGILRRFKSVVDAPCGDHNWMQHVDIGINYIGFDAFEENLRLCRSRRNADFRRCDLVNDEVPECDVILCRDFLVHLTLTDAVKVVEKFKRAAKFLIVTTFPVTENRELTEVYPGWGWRELNMELAPFNLVELDGVDENEGQGKRLALHQL